VSAYEPPPAERGGQLVRTIRAVYRTICHRRPPKVTVECDREAGRCNFRAGNSGGNVGYNEPVEGTYC